MRYIRCLITALALAVVVAACSPAVAAEGKKAQGGVLDLTGMDLESKTVSLDGAWEFYWNQFLQADDFPTSTPDCYMEVPSTWNDYAINGQNIPGQGYATYRLHVKTGLPPDTMLGLRIYSLSSAYRLYVNDTLVAQSGRPGTNKVEETGEYRPQAVVFSTPGEEFDIIVQISNFVYARGGIWYSMEFGGQQPILLLHDELMAKETFLLGALAILALFLLAVFWLRRELKYFLYFAFLTLVGALALDMVGQFMLLRLLPWLNLESIICIWYSSATWLWVFLLLFYHDLYTSRFSQFCLKACFGLAILEQLAFLVLSTTLYTSFGRILNLFDMAAATCSVLIVAIGIRQGQKDGWLSVVGMLVILVSYVHDVLYWTNMIGSRYGEILYFGIFLFLFFQMVILARRIREFHQQMTAAELSFLQAQIKPHFLYNALNTVISISRYDTDRSRELLINFSNYLRRSFDFKGLSQFVPLSKEIELVKAYIEIQKARFEEAFEVDFAVCEDLEVKVPILMLQPVVENAIVHGVLPAKEGGRIEIRIQKQDKYLSFSVRDNGVGIEKLPDLEDDGRPFGHGVGLANIHRRLKDLYRKGLHISSAPGQGTEVTWLIPLNK